MKLTVLGGGGVRSPLLVSAVLRRAARLGLDELCLMDTDAEKLHLTGALAQYLTLQAGSPLRLTTTTDPRQALSGARYVITTIRAGYEEGRILDERIALRRGVLGQETTGPGGFAMALRSIPAILQYAALLEQLSPGAWIFNFTNPAGLVTQALRDAGYNRTIGICDSANAAQNAVAAWLGEDPRALRAEVYGLNHLSWGRRVWRAGQEQTDLLHPLLHEPGFQAATLLHLFEPALIRRVDMYLNEYLFYYYYRDEALRQVLAHAQTRGEEVAELNHALLEELRQVDPVRFPGAALETFYTYKDRRSATYMPYAAPGQPAPQAPVKQRAERTHQQEEEGYAGVALNIMEALESGTPLYTALNVPNAGAIPGMQAGDVVEVSCRVERGEVSSLPVAEDEAGLYPPALELMRSVKLYERLTVEAIRTRSRATAVEALMCHPLVGSYSLAKTLVEEYLTAHREYVGEWE
jgi:6-phospho-beta-glucosidase